MKEMHKVSEIIKALQEMYNPDDKIIAMWWDRNLPYLEHTVSEKVWSDVLDKLEFEQFEIPSGMIWDTIAEAIEAYYKKNGGDNG